MVFKVFLLLFGILLQETCMTEALECRLCKSKERLDDCDERVTCGANEECFMDELVSYRGITYEGGCRSIDVCSAPSPLGKRSGESLIACSRCCSVEYDNVTGLECNARLCGIKYDANNVKTCYQCTNVRNPAECNTLATCQHDEVCGSKTMIDGFTHSYTLGCFKEYCIATTAITLKYAHNDSFANNNPTTPPSPTHPPSVPNIPTHPPTSSNVLGRRSPITGCDICCGDPYCNTGDCVSLFKKLQYLESTGHLDISTVQYRP